MVIKIHKEAGARRDALKINSEGDIPEFLRNSIKVKDFFLILVCVGGGQLCPIGSVIEWEKSDETSTGYSCRSIKNVSTLTEIDGVFYDRAPTIEAERIGEEFPAFLKGADISRNPDGSWSIKTKWGIRTGFPDKAYWIRYGTDSNGKPIADILMKTNWSYEEYLVCDVYGRDIGWLSEIDPVDSPVDPA